MTGLTPHLARTLVDDRLRRAERARGVRRRSRRDPDALALLAAAERGDDRAWAVLDARYGPRLRSVARGYRLPPHDVEDVLQTTWLRLVENIRRVRDPDAVGAWLETTTRRECLALLRLRKRERPVEDGSVAEQSCEPVDERRLVATEQRTALASGLARLPGRQRRLLVALLAEPAPSYREIADALDMPIGSIGPTRARTLARLRRDGVIAGIAAEDVAAESRVR